MKGESGHPILIGNFTIPHTNFLEYAAIQGALELKAELQLIS